MSLFRRKRFESDISLSATKSAPVIKNPKIAYNTLFLKPARFSADNTGEYPSDTFVM